MIKLNSLPLDFGSFPNGETSVPGELPVFDLSTINRIDFRYENDGDLIRLMFLKRHLDLGGYRSRLHVHYMPYSRMDRSQDGSVFTLKYLAEFINGLGFERVVIAEPHSDVTMALIDRSTAIYPTVQLLPQVMAIIDFNPARDSLLFPDAGAEKRYCHQIKGVQYAIGQKRRDFESGKLLGLQIGGGFKGDCQKVIIVDDLCSRGGTFAAAAEQLRAIEIPEIYLLVTHCEPVVREGRFFDRKATRDGHGEITKSSGLIDRVFTTNSIFNIPDGTGLIQVFDVEAFFANQGGVSL